MPTAPTPAASVVVSGLTVSGKVYDTAYRPLAGATVQVVNGLDAGLSTVATLQGQYTLTGAFDAATQFRATKAGYGDSVETMPAPCAQCNPPHWIYFRLGLPVAPADIAGDYTLTINADASCSMLPPEMRSRTYAARIAAQPNQPTTAVTSFLATISGATVLSGVQYPDLWIDLAGDYLSMELGDLHGQPGVVDQVYENAFFAFGGLGRTTVATGRVSTITTAFDGGITYCVLTPGRSPIDSEGRYACGPPHSDTYAVCRAKGHQLILMRQ